MRSVLIFSFVLSLSSIAFGQNSELSSGTIIQVMIETRVSSEEGDSVQAYVFSDIKDDEGNILIAAQTPVVVEVTRNELRRVGRPGSVELRVKSTTATDGQIIKLHGVNYVEGEDRNSTVLLASLIPTAVGFWPMIFYLLKKGGEAEIPTETLMPEVLVAGNYEIGME